MKLRIWNTLSKGLTEVSSNKKDGKLRIYNCGPTVYASPHIGNIRRFVVADILVRSLSFLGYDTWSVMNITDVGHLLDTSHDAAGTDRMLLAAEREHQTPEEIAAKYTQEFFTALQLLRAEPAQFYPRATMHVPFMIELIKRLIDKEVAYETPSGVYFDVTKFPEYGKLSGNKTAEVESGARIDIREEKRHATDFALWIKAPQEHLMQWDSPWGRGYPGWHIECSAMATHALGETLDIHTGGEDNMFPHHENEIAQSEAATGKPFARIWMHNAHLLVEGKKMSKSAGTFISLAKVMELGYDPLSLRFLYLQTHYRSKLNFTWSSLDSAVEGLNTLQRFIQNVVSSNSNDNEDNPNLIKRTEKALDDFTSAIAEDLGTPQALAIIFDLVRDLNPVVSKNILSAELKMKIISSFKEFDKVLALFNFEEQDSSDKLPPEVRKLTDERELARKNKDFALSDSLREQLKKLGYNVEDTANGPRLTPVAKP